MVAKLSRSVCRAFPLGWLVASACLAAGGCGLTSKAQNAQGVRLYQQGAYPTAQQRFQQAIYNDPLNADSYYNLAATYHQTGKQEGRQADQDQAESYYNQCLDHNPN